MRSDEGHLMSELGRHGGAVSAQFYADRAVTSVGKRHRDSSLSSLPLVPLFFSVWIGT